MKTMLSARIAANALLVALGALMVFHVSIIFGVLPSSLVWGGRAADSAESLQRFEAVGLVVTGLFAAIVAAKIGYLKAPRLRRAIRVSMWVVFAYFVLNILGNLVSSSTLEKSIFTPLSFLLALLALRLAIEE